ncbi:hypothetical protein IFT48_03660 [Pseudomonas fluorescens]|uniref:hypothetical protein n=1 Tax=Pseudomonas fluorescens TaxID=294 RepID=UPI001930D690|nr:hypothetical protein [Pseudomonas fluorescens]MBD8089066.1 hypothetical protein [Pseudomonas fluorescens]
MTIKIRKATIMPRISQNDIKPYEGFDKFYNSGFMGSKDYCSLEDLQPKEIWEIFESTGKPKISCLYEIYMGYHTHDFVTRSISRIAWDSLTNHDFVDLLVEAIKSHDFLSSTQPSKRERRIGYYQLMSSLSKDDKLKEVFNDGSVQARLVHACYGLKPSTIAPIINNFESFNKTVIHKHGEKKMVVSWMGALAFNPGEDENDIDEVLMHLMTQYLKPNYSSGYCHDSPLDVVFRSKSKLLKERYLDTLLWMKKSNLKDAGKTHSLQMLNLLKPIGELQNTITKEILLLAASGKIKYFDFDSILDANDLDPSEVVRYYNRGFRFGGVYLPSQVYSMVEDGQDSKIYALYAQQASMRNIYLSFENIYLECFNRKLEPRVIAGMITGQAAKKEMDSILAFEISLNNSFYEKHNTSQSEKIKLVLLGLPALEIARAGLSYFNNGILFDPSSLSSYATIGAYAAALVALPDGRAAISKTIMKIHDFTNLVLEKSATLLSQGLSISGLTKSLKDGFLYKLTALCRPEGHPLDIKNEAYFLRNTKQAIIENEFNRGREYPKEISSNQL